MKRNELSLRRSIIEICRRMDALGMNQGTSGNVSARDGDRVLITPSGIPCDEMRPEDIAAMPLDAEDGSWNGPLRPSSEWRFHLDIMRSRPDVGAVVHAHPTHSTVLAICGREIPACHYMVAVAGGPSIRVAGYATFGTKELSLNAIEALEDRTCCLLANHGMIATGADPESAFRLALEVETLARQYFLSLLIGGPNLLPDEEIARVQEKFRSYGPRAQDGPVARR